MPVDPTDPDTVAEEEYGQEPQAAPAGLEAPPEDAAEQHTDLLRGAPADRPGPRDPGAEVNPADAQEQQIEVELNEDEYR